MTFETKWVPSGTSRLSLVTSASQHYQYGFCLAADEFYRTWCENNTVEDVFALDKKDRIRKTAKRGDVYSTSKKYHHIRH